MTDSQKNIIRIITEEMGLDPDTLGEMSLKTSIKSLINKFGYNSEENLLFDLTNNPKSLQELIEEVKVPETWFFRDIESFNYLTKFASVKLRSNNTLPIKILSAPCSTGEEPYSIAMALKNINYISNQYKIVAVDISEVNIEKAKIGIYTKTSLRNLDNNIIERYFTKNDSKFELSSEIKNSNIEFLNLNLIKEFNKFDDNEFDVIYFKNLLIYLNDSSRQYILTNLKRVLKEDGILFVGVSELNYFIRNGFEPIEHKLAFGCKIKKDKVKIILNEKREHKKRVLTAAPPKKQITKPKSIVPEKKIENKEIFDSKFIKKLMDSGKYNEAENELENYIKKSIDNYEIYFNKGLIKYVNHSYELAKDNFIKSLYLEPNNYDTLIYLSLVEKELGFIDKSETYRLRAEKVYNRNQNE